jgi:chromate transporter
VAAGRHSRRAKVGLVLDVFLTFLLLGCRAFGGPIAHLGYFHGLFVERRRWVDEATYVEIVALCSFLPGPTSSQVGITLGTLRAGVRGAFAAWLGFTLPSAILMMLVAYGLPLAGNTPWVHVLLLVAVGVVADAILTMARTLTPDVVRIVLAAVGAAIALRFPGVAGQLGVLALGALAGIALLREAREDVAPLRFPISRTAGALVLLAFALLVAALPFLARISETFALVAALIRAGSLVFGGGHVVLPLLHAAFVPRWIDDAHFLAGYGAAQALPGPLFTFAAFLGASASAGPRGWLGATIATCAIFAPSFFLIFGIAPFWRDVRGNVLVAAAIRGLGAAVVGLLFAAFVTPIWTSAIASWRDVAIAAAIFAAIRLRRLLATRAQRTAR